MEELEKNNGWVLLHREIRQWEWYKDSNMVHLFIHLLVSANFKDGKWKGVEIKRGQLLTGLNALNEVTGISIRTLRTCLSKLERTGEIARKSTSKFSIITICNYDEYQNKQEATDKQVTSNRQASDKQVTTNNNDNNDNNENNVCEEGAPPTLEEVKKYFKDCGYRDGNAKKAWLSYEAANWHDSKGHKIRNWKQKIAQVWFEEKDRILTLKEMEEQTKNHSY
jgi:hypothetical protein